MSDASSFGTDPTIVSEADPEIGRVLDGRYRIDGVLGRGGMGSVYRGEHLGIAKTVAIKLLHPALGRSTDAAARFQREALATGRLDHPNIVAVTDSGACDDGACFLVMEALEGESLRDRLDRVGRLPWREAVAIAREILAALGHAHERGVVHRDIKPDNVFLARKDGEAGEVVKLLDFGIAKLFAGLGDDPVQTQAGFSVGTPAYLSPEQAVGGEITPATDLYSMSTVLFEMLAGDAPFRSKDPLEMVTAHIGRAPPRIGEVATDVILPAGLEEIIHRGLAKRREERIASAGQYLAMLAPFAAGGAGGVGGGHGIRRAGARAWQLARRAWLWTRDHARPAWAWSRARVGRAWAWARARSVQAYRWTWKRAARAIAWLREPQRRRLALGAGAVIIVLVGVLIGYLAMPGSGGNAKEPGAGSAMASPRGGGEPAPKAPAANPTPPPRAPASVTTSPSKDALAAALNELKRGATCEARRAAVVRLAEIGDPAAIPEIRRARHRMRGGFLGFGQTNSNACLRKDADAAIAALGTAASPSR